MWYHCVHFASFPRNSCKTLRCRAGKVKGARSGVLCLVRGHQSEPPLTAKLRREFEHSCMTSQTRYLKSSQLTWRFFFFFKSHLSLLHYSSWSFLNSTFLILSKYQCLLLSQEITIYIITLVGIFSSVRYALLNSLSYSAWVTVMWLLTTDWGYSSLHSSSGWGQRLELCSSFLQSGYSLFDIRRMLVSFRKEDTYKAQKPHGTDKTQNISISNEFQFSFACSFIDNTYDSTKKGTICYNRPRNNVM